MTEAGGVDEMNDSKTERGLRSELELLADRLDGLSRHKTAADPRLLVAAVAKDIREILAAHPEVPRD